jgi:hypothetical protein
MSPFVQVFGRRPSECVENVIPAAENLHKSKHQFDFDGEDYRTL